MKAGFILLFISSILFFIFGSFLGGPQLITQYWPLLLIAAGLWSMLRSLFGRKKAVPAESVQPVETIEEVVEEIVEEDTEGEKNEN